MTDKAKITTYDELHAAYENAEPLLPVNRLGATLGMAALLTAQFTRCWPLANFLFRASTHYSQKCFALTPTQVEDEVLAGQMTSAAFCRKPDRFFKATSQWLALKEHTLTSCGWPLRLLANNEFAFVMSGLFILSEELHLPSADSTPFDIPASSGHRHPTVDFLRKTTFSLNRLTRALTESVTVPSESECEVLRACALLKAHCTLATIQMLPDDADTELITWTRLALDHNLTNGTVQFRWADYGIEVDTTPPEESLPDEAFLSLAREAVQQLEDVMLDLCQHGANADRDKLTRLAQNLRSLEK